MQLNNLSLFRLQSFINGQWIDADNGATLDVINPASQRLIGHVASLGAAEATRAVQAASDALPAWRALTAKQRSAILRRWFDLILLHQEDLALLLSTEQGKSMTESRGEIAYGASFIEWFAEECKRIPGDVIPTDRAGRRLLVIRQPVGVVAAITPWNFPCAMITRKVAPALAAGCTVVVKPSEETPLSALALAVLGEQAGFPAGVLNMVTSADAAAVGAVLTQHPAVRKLSFTGSTDVGKLLMAQCAATIKKISLELGGNAPFIVFDDADLNAAVPAALASKFRNSGQTCVCTNRFLVQDGIYDAFAEKFTAAVKKLRVAAATDPACEQGPLINQAAVLKVQQHISDALDRGARILAGGKPHALGGTFFEPTVLGDVTPQMLVAREETFGPLAPIFRFRSEEEAIRMANDTESGLASYIFTRDPGRSWRVAEALEYGMVGINEGLISTEVAPFGGVKESGIGREGSKYGIEDFLEIKYLCVGGIGA